MIPLIELSYNDPNSNVGAGAGILLLAKSTGRCLFMHRSRECNEPLTWALPGGKVDPGENPKEAARREIWEEAGIKVKNDLTPLYVFKKPKFQFHNFLSVTLREVKPKLNWESLGYMWADYGDWPEPLHSGVRKLLNDKVSLKIIEGAL